MTGQQESSSKQRRTVAVKKFLFERRYTLYVVLIFFFTGTFCVLWYTFKGSSSDEVVPSSVPPTSAPEPITPFGEKVETKAPSTGNITTEAPSSTGIFTERPSSTEAPSFVAKPSSTEVPSSTDKPSSTEAPSSSQDRSSTPTQASLSSSMPTRASPTLAFTGAPSETQQEPTATPTSPVTTELVSVVYIGNSTSNPELFPLGLCEGSCRSDIECDFGLVCVPPINERVPGCQGSISEEAILGSDFCTRPTKPNMLVVQGFGGQPAKAFPLGECQGSCRQSDDCRGNLECHERENANDEIPGCVGTGVELVRYCVVPPKPTEPPQNSTATPTTVSTAVVVTVPPSTSSTKMATPSPTTKPITSTSPPTNEQLNKPGSTSPTKMATPSPTTKPITSTSPPTNEQLNKPVSTVRNRPLRIKENKCKEWSRCRRCEGNCEGNDENCKPGLVCVSRTTDEVVDGCNIGGNGDISGIDYCVKIGGESNQISPKASYIPGDRSLIENGLLLSTGLTAKIVAIKDQKVQYGNGGESDVDMHEDPDGAAVFADEESGGWIYVSNAESTKNGGVGAITFNSNGDVVRYEKIVDGLTRRNCGGGKTWWGSFLTCEEDEGGQVWEVDPKGKRVARQTLLGGAGAKYESAAYDNRDIWNPSFFVTTDEINGPVVKYVPDQKAIKTALATDPPDYSNLLHTNQTGTARLQYLVLLPRESDQDKGSFYWTENLDKGRESAFNYSQNCEGIDVRQGILYFTCKKDKSLFILDLDEQRFERSSTKSGAFDNGPDQVARLLGDDESAILYFCEDGGKKGTCGVHGRDINGKLYTILESHDESYIGETTGLAFSPDNMHMYVSFQRPGIIFDVTRTDGFPFGGQRLDIKYHEDERNSMQK